MKISYIGKIKNEYLLEYKQHETRPNYYKCLMLAKVRIRENNSPAGRLTSNYKYIKICMIKDCLEIQDYVQAGAGELNIAKEITVHDTCGNY